MCIVAWQAVHVSEVANFRVSGQPLSDIVPMFARDTVPQIFVSTLLSEPYPTPAGVSIATDRLSDKQFACCHQDDRSFSDSGWSVIEPDD